MLHPSIPYLRRTGLAVSALANCVPFSSGYGILDNVLACTSGLGLARSWPTVPSVLKPTFFLLYIIRLC